MSLKVDHESQELLDLRNELLSGLNKKKPRRSEPAIEEDKELEKLRLEALNGKRASLEGKPKNRLPGRFRYQRDSEEENDEEDDGDYCPLPSVSFDEDEDQLNAREDQTSTFKSNYEAYKRECNKLMAHDAYEPSGEPGTSDLNSLRLKNLRERVEHKLKNGTTEPYDPVGDQDHIDLDYVPMKKDSLDKWHKSSSRKDSNRFYSSSSSDEDSPTVNKKLRSVIIVPASRPPTSELSNGNSNHSPSKESRHHRSRSRSRQRNRDRSKSHDKVRK